MLSLFSVVQTGLKLNQIFEDVIKLASISRRLLLSIDNKVINGQIHTISSNRIKKRKGFGL